VTTSYEATKEGKPQLANQTIFLSRKGKKQAIIRNIAGKCISNLNHKVLMKLGRR